MCNIQTEIPNITLVSPDPGRDAPFALQWFTSRKGKATLLLMGNAENEIKPSTLESETKIIEEFIELERENKQLTWMIRDQDKTIGASWIELVDTPDVKSPAIHIMIGDSEYRGKGIGRIVIREMLRYLSTDPKVTEVYSRYLADNIAARNSLGSCGFITDGEVYSDGNDLRWQNVHRRM